MARHASHHQLALGPMLANPVALAETSEGKSVAPERRQLLRDAIDSAGWKHDAVACALGVEAAYLSKMLAGEKPITLRHLDLLPGDVATEFDGLCAEARGLVVVPRLIGKAAQRAAAAGIFALLMRGAA